MRVLSSCILSLLIHGLVFALVLLGPFQGSKSAIDLDKPVYEVELVRAPAPEPEPESKPEQEVSKEEKASQEEPGERPEAAKARQSPGRDSGAEKIPRKSRAPERERKKAEKSADTQKRRTREKPEAHRAPTGDAVLDKALQDLQKDVESEREQDRTVSRELENLREQRSAAERGEAASAQREKLYASLVERRIKQNWRFPPVGGDIDLVAVVRVRVEPDGSVAEYTLVSGSGRSDYNDSVLRAIEETERLPEPPRDLDTISITFNLRELRR